MGDKILAVCDCETDPFTYPEIPRPFLWGFYDGKNLLYFDTTKKFVEYVKPRNLNLYAHNGGKFDFLFLSDYFPEPCTPTMINGRIAKMKFSDTCTLLDSFCLYPMALKTTGEKLDFDYSKLHRDVRHKHMPEIRKYLAGDCLALYKMLATYKATLGHGLTNAGNSFRALRELCGNGTPYNPQSLESEDETIRPYYFGGRTEIFKRTMKKGLIVDMVSAYPWAMQSAHPAQTGEFIRVKKFRKSGVGFYTIESRSLGAFPLRNDEGRLTFPNDGETRIFNVTSHELKAFLNVNPSETFKVIRGFHYDNLISFRPFVKHFFAMKENSPKDSIERILAKNCLTSPYGKLGQDCRDYKEYMITPYGYTLKQAKLWRSKGWSENAELETGRQWTRPLPAKRRRFYNVAAAASITGQVRARLYEAMQACQGVAYCDTDSIFCESTGDLELSDSLGSFSVEGTIRKAHIGGKKLYVVELADGTHKLRSKGAKLALNDIVNVCVKGKEVHLTGDRSRFSASLFSGFQWREKVIKRT